jgi:hypothetical protein
MSELSPDELSNPTARAARTAELARRGTDPVAKRRRALDCERKRRASAKAPPVENQHELRAFGPIVTALNQIMSVQS